MTGPSKRNPVAKAVTRVRPQVVPDKRRIWDTSHCPDCLELLRECRCRPMETINEQPEGAEGGL